MISFSNFLVDPGVFAFAGVHHGIDNMDDFLLPKLYTYEQVSQMIDLKVSTLKWAVRTGKLPYRKYGREIRFTENDLLVYINNCVVSSASHAGSEATNG